MKELMMESITSKFRLRSSAFERSDEVNKIAPKRMVILSVEGDQTERQYFEHLNNHLDTSLIKVEVLRHRRGDGYSDPEHVIDLLNEYMLLREGEVIPEDLPQIFLQKYSKEFIQKYLENDASLMHDERIEFQEELFVIGIDLEYRRYLKTFTNENDFFGIIIDRDCQSHNRQLMEQCVKICDERGYKCFLSNPCFEFWLLLHLCNLKSEFSEGQLQELLINEKVSNNHTRTSLEVSKRAHHNKYISATVFKTKYLPNISSAIIQSKEFASTLPDLFDKMGTNISQLFDILGYN